MGGKCLGTCSIAGCDKPTKARRLCAMHYDRWRFDRPMEAPERYHQRPAKGWIAHGYRYVCTPDGQEVREHRYVMEQHLGRPLRPDEDVHHRNRDRLDNRIENLDVVEHRAHVSLHQNEGGRRRAAICPECGQSFLRLSWRPNQTCSKHCGLKRMWRRRRAAA